MEKIIKEGKSVEAALSALMEENNLSKEEFLYTSNVKKGKLKITPKEIKVEISNFEKIYGNADPDFTFSFAQPKQKPC